MDISDNLMYLRIMLTKLCDGFSLNNSSKCATFTTRLKVLYLLEKKDCCPSELIENLCIAKSNLVNILKPMIAEKVVISYKNNASSKNISYSITDKGRDELSEYKSQLLNMLKSKCSILNNEHINKKLTEFIQLLKELNYD